MSEGATDQIGAPRAGYEDHARHKEPGEAFIITGWVAVFVGLLTVVVALFMQTSTTLPDGSGLSFSVERVHNIGRQQTQLIAVLVGSALFIAGVLMAVGGAILRQIHRGPGAVDR
jgi:hypothetical protein